jgi:hypothetical protein
MYLDATMAAARPPRNWDALATGTKRRWIGQAGGPRSLGHAERERRAARAYESGVALAVEHSGHAGTYERNFAQVVTTSGVVAISTTSRVEGSRIGAHCGDVAALMEAREDPAAWAARAAEFEHRWRRRVRTAGRYELEWRADFAVTGAVEAGPPPSPFYTKRQVRAPRRSKK